MRQKYWRVVKLEERMSVERGEIGGSPCGSQERGAGKKGERVGFFFSYLKLEDSLVNQHLQFLVLRYFNIFFSMVKHTHGYYMEENSAEQNKR